MPRIVEEIRTSLSDIVCFQELDLHNKIYSRELNKIGYDLSEVERHTKNDGIAIAWN